MFKKALFAIIVAAVLLAIPMTASAKPKQTISIEDITYSYVKTVPTPIDETVPFDLATTKFSDKGQLYYAEGSGIATSGFTDPNLPFYFKQLFAFQVEGDSVKVLTAARLRTELEDGTPIEPFFKGRGTGTITCGGDYCELSILLVKMGEYEKASKNTFISSKTKSGAKLTLNIIARIHIDHTSAGIVLLPDEDGVYMSGSAKFAGFGKTENGSLGIN